MGARKRKPPVLTDCETGEIINKSARKSSKSTLPVLVDDLDEMPDIDPFCFCKYRSKPVVRYKKQSAFSDFLDKYFKMCDCDSDNRFYSIPGLANHIGVKAKEAFADYEEKATAAGVPPDYIAAVIAALQKIEGQEIQLAHDNQSFKGASLILVSQFGYSTDKEIGEKIENSNFELHIVRAEKPKEEDKG